MVSPFKRPTPTGSLEARIAALSARRPRNAADSAPEPAVAADPVNGSAAEIAAFSPAAAEIVVPASSEPPEPEAPAVESGAADADESDQAAALRDQIAAQLSLEIPPEIRKSFGRRELAKIIEAALQAQLARDGIEIESLRQRDLVTAILHKLRPQIPLQSAESREEASRREAADGSRRSNRAAVETAKLQIQPLVLEHMDVAAAASMPRAAFEAQLTSWVKDLLNETKIQLNYAEQRELVDSLIADMLGLGPLEPLLADETVTDIMVNGPKQVYVERRGKLEVTDVQFRDDQHVLNVATKIVTRIGRRVDESQPLVDARLTDGSRVNIIIPPLAIDGPSISIRKFSKKSITLDTMAQQGNISPEMAILLKIAARSRLNILISGGTGSGKTTLLNALSRMIDAAERTVTIEDAAELQLQQPHVVRLETRPPNIEGTGEITMRDLVRNALRMRPDRIILGEIRGAEALDVLQAMNTGHDGSMSTIHANRPREALTRLENMVGMTGINLPARAVRTQIAAAVNLVVQVSRMRDGMRRVVQVTEIVGMEGDIITTQDLFTFQFQGEAADGKLRGIFKSAGVRPHFLPRAEYFGLDRALLEVI
ncbi:MAG TPA: ATPase, T2SS/T4P/T4SS family [Stellaceae bacterium]|nr:ATPase, T2SS/T4P/T4SS family [Stellaceae bacterium]